MKRLAIGLLGLTLAGCGAKTGLDLRSPDAGPRMDAAPPDAGSDGGFDAGLDAGFDGGIVCVPGNIRLNASRVEVVFVIDRSGSMNADFAGGPARPLESRWEILEASLSGALDTFDDTIGVGAKFFPTQTIRATEGPCDVFGGLEVPIGPGRAPGIISQFGRYNPNGGTPVGPAVRAALDALLERSDEDSAQFIVVATDGAPTCGPDPVGDATAVIGEAHEMYGVDVYVLGIASTAPEVDLLDRMAVIGGRARPASEGSRFYDASDPMLLDALLSSIARDLVQCVFRVPIPPGDDDVIEVFVSGDLVARDESRESGWDWTSDRRSQLSLFGAACERAIASGGRVRADITCN